MKKKERERESACCAGPSSLEARSRQPFYRDNFSGTLQSFLSLFLACVFCFPLSLLVEFACESNGDCCRCRSFAELEDLLQAEMALGRFVRFFRVAILYIYIYLYVYTHQSVQYNI